MGMTAIFAALSAAGALKWIGVAVAALLALGASWFHGKSTGATQATNAAQGKVDTAVAQATQAQADAKQAQATTDAVRVAAEAHDAAQAIPDADLDAAGAKLHIVRND